MIASGSEVELALETQKQLKEDNIDSKVVSMPCQELFNIQSREYKNEILDKESTVITIEAGGVSSWKKYIGKKGLSLGVETFGESAPYKEVYDHFNLTSDKIVNLIKKILKR